METCVDDYLTGLWVNKTKMLDEGYGGEALYLLKDVFRFQPPNIGLTVGNNFMAARVFNIGGSSDAYFDVAAMIDVDLVPFRTRWQINSGRNADDVSSFFR